MAFSQQSEPLPHAPAIWICVYVYVAHEPCLSLVSPGSDQRSPSCCRPHTPPEPCPSAPPDEQNRVILQAETLEYIQQTKRVVATGNVRVIYGDSASSPTSLSCIRRLRPAQPGDMSDSSRRMTISKRAGLILISTPSAGCSTTPRGKPPRSITSRVHVLNGWRRAAW